MEPINLNRVRKARAKAADKAKAQENRAKHGRTGAQKAADRAGAEAAVARLDGHRRERGDDSA